MLMAENHTTFEAWTNEDMTLIFLIVRVRTGVIRDSFHLKQTNKTQKPVSL